MLQVMHQKCHCLNSKLVIKKDYKNLLRGQVLNERKKQRQMRALSIKAMQKQKALHPNCHRGKAAKLGNEEEGTKQRNFR